ncbi:hypothetical protein B9Z55_000610 [Caenorhabditis nigoni]|uniref:Helitron helicase-like domain-containing protein n=1 Tax=Caenorhabditis nigoni TaxID=1611254 RepID=A0A2G5S8N3_9PELO|nr:hypothetical protein B9Z55_029136 [Caenorhabditis nigoni]PIC55267.1 hypothetical protein B9Z55_000610 [Caenorhabditis nigoni]
MDHINAEDDGPCGQRIFLPNTFTGSPRHFVSLYQDALAVVSRFGKPDLFLTMTCNPSWKEIQEALLPGQEAVDRPDVVSRVFKLKLEELKKDLFFSFVFCYRRVPRSISRYFPKFEAPSSSLSKVMARFLKKA